MKKNNKKIILYIVLAITIFVVVKIAYFEFFKLCGNCGIPPSQNILTLTKNHSNLLITYSSNNGSLPPPYHRERVVTILTDKTGKIKGTYTVGDYKTVIEEKSLTVSREQLNKLITAAAKINPKADEGSVSGCMGGTSKSIEISQNKKTLLETSAYNCAMKSSNESLDKFFFEAEQIIPKNRTIK